MRSVERPSVLKVAKRFTVVVGLGLSIGTAFFPRDVYAQTPMACDIYTPLSLAIFKNATPQTMTWIETLQGRAEDKDVNNNIPKEYLLKGLENEEAGTALAALHILKDRDLVTMGYDRRLVFVSMMDMVANRIEREARDRFIKETKFTIADLSLETESAACWRRKADPFRR